MQERQLGLFQSIKEVGVSSCNTVVESVSVLENTAKLVNKGILLTSVLMDEPIAEAKRDAAIVRAKAAKQLADLGVTDVEL